MNVPIPVFNNAHWLLRLSLAMIPVLLGAIIMVHDPRWSFVPAEGLPMGGMEFQVVLTLVAAYFLIMGNSQPEDK